MRVFVYWNLHKGVFSVKALDGAQKGRVVAHATDVLVRDVEFRVSQRVRERVVATGRKEVHAGVVGTLEGFKGESTAAGDRAYLPGWERQDRLYRNYALDAGTYVTYNPRRFSTFMACDFSGPETVHTPIHRAEMALCTMPALKAKRTGTVWVFDPCDMPAHMSLGADA